jgi:hypothetical protein
VLPDRQKLTQVPVSQGMGGGDDLPHPHGLPEGDRVDHRRYAPGDPVRNILWKTYARNRQLMVRTPERALAPARRTVAYLVTGDGDEPAAAAARVALETGALGRGWTFGADGSDLRATEVTPALELVSGSAEAATRGLGGGLKMPAFFDDAEKGGDARCVVFAPARPGPWLLPLETVARRRPGRLTVVLTVDGVEQPRRRSPLLRLFTRLLVRPAVNATTPAALLDEAVRRCAAAGADVLTLDRPHGRSYGRTHRRVTVPARAARAKASTAAPTRDPATPPGVATGRAA